MLIPVYALRDDGKSVTCMVKANDDNHAKNKMCWWLNEFYQRGRDCEAIYFTMYVGKENYHAFTAARRERRRTG